MRMCACVFVCVCNVMVCVCVCVCVCVFQHLQPSAMVEKALVRLAMVAMEMVECGGGGGEDGEGRVHEVWSQLANKLVFFYFLQLINITSLINQLREKVRLISS